MNNICRFHGCDCYDRDSKKCNGYKSYKDCFSYGLHQKDIRDNGRERFR